MANLVLNKRSIDSLDEIEENFVDADVLTAFRSGALASWLDENAYDDELVGIRRIDANANEKVVIEGVIRALGLDRGKIERARQTLSAARRQQEERERREREERQREEARQRAEEKRLNEERERREREKMPGAVKTIRLPDGVEMRFRWCPPGTFMMGSPSTERQNYYEEMEDETQHQVTLTKGFWMGETTVTQRQWQSVMGSNPSYFQGADHPVEKVSWDDCQGFIQQVNRRMGGAIRLPTEAEWEYACRAGTTTPYGGTGNLDEMGWNSGSPTHPVAQMKPNAWGLYDMHGNVWEWCADWWGDYPTGNVTDPVGPSSGASRVVRGGGWNGSAWACRSAYRYGHYPFTRTSYIGLRLLCSAGPRG